MKQVIKAPPQLKGEVMPPGDKSISHRAAMLNAISQGSAHISNFCVGNDRLSMLRCLRGLGVRITRHADCTITNSHECFEIRGVGLDGLREPSNILNAGNSGTTIRLLAGLLSGQRYFSVLTGDSSLRSRPMGRIIEPLAKMGAKIMGRANGSLAPLAITGGELNGIRYVLPIASAQLKSCLLIAGLYAKGQTVLTQPALSRDHTERMMASMGAEITIHGKDVSIERSKLSAMDIRIPSDTSGSAFWLVAGCCHPNASITVKNVGMNPTRTGILEVLRSMGANIKILNLRDEGGEPTADLVAETSTLRPTDISGDLIPRVIDELPVLALAACFANGTSTISGAGELRVKESDRIIATADGLRRLGAKVLEKSDGLVIRGGSALVGSECSSYNDHRIAMTLGIAGLVAKGETVVLDSDAVDISYPNFWDTCHVLGRSSQ